MKIIILLPFLATLSGCLGINTDILKSKNAQIEDRNIYADVTQSDAKDKSNSKTLDKIPNQPLRTEQKAIDKFKHSGINFVLYFPYDDTDISQANTQSVIKHANFMRNNPQIQLRLEGHADERGTREYNLALGENRALSIKEVLSLYEGLSHRIEVISFGEEYPVSNSRNETAWQKNRRVEFIYQ